MELGQFGGNGKQEEGEEVQGEEGRMTVVARVVCRQKEPTCSFFGVRLRENEEKEGSDEQDDREGEELLAGGGELGAMIELLPQRQVVVHPARGVLVRRALDHVEHQKSYLRDSFSSDRKSVV